MVKKKVSSRKSKEVLVDEGEALKVIENHEFIAMRAAEKIWPFPTTTEDQLQELVSDSLIQDQGLADWKTPGEHRIPSPGPCWTLPHPCWTLPLSISFFIVFFNTLVFP
jgi:hypothetical protein